MSAKNITHFENDNCEINYSHIYADINYDMQVYCSSLYDINQYEMQLWKQ